MRVAVSVHGRYHAFALATQLHRAGVLSQLATTYPAFIARRFLPEGVRLSTIAWLEVLRRLHGRFGGPSPDLLIARRFGRFAASVLPGDADLLVGWSSASLEAARLAKGRGMKVVIERGSTHIVHQDRVLAEAHAKLDLPYAGIDPGIIAREVEEYALADMVVTGSQAAAASFAPNGVAAAKVAVNPYGVDLGRFGAIRPQRREGGKLCVLFVGQVGVRKGVPWLIEAFDRLGGGAKLRLVGPVDSAFKAYLARRTLDGITLTGPKHGTELEQEFARADIFCLPSIEEGLALVVLQALAAGLPVVASHPTGAGDIAAAQPLLVPPADAEALAGALAALGQDPERRVHLSTLGPKAVSSGFTWDDYGRRALALYQSLLYSNDRPE